ncbi:MAG: glycerol-3-phosphate dehydrogenase/oxidase [Anaerolineales bacterium]
MKRKETWNRIRKDPEVSVLIIGAGINGIGTFRDLALQGVDCLIVDQGDFCSGASMASSHMLHGGIRYLENGEFRLVREALHERNNLLRNAPHLTRPLPTTIPIFKWFSGLFNAPLKFIGLLDKPAERGAIIIKIGLMLYDAYVRGDSPMPGHHMDNRQEALRKWPQLNPRIRFAATYYDGAMPSPERLSMEILQDGEAEGDHAAALNYVSAVGSTEGAVLLRDELSGEELPVRPQIVVNAGGPWIDFVNARVDGKTQFIGGTKGSHLIIDHPGLREAIGDHEFFFEYVDGRIVLIFPFRDQVLLGTTDIRIEDPDQAACTEEEIEYILGMVPHVFPELEVRRQDIIFQFSGVRPLPPARGATGQISRDHSIEIVEKNPGQPWPILSLVGGKWTSYRALSEETSDEVLQRLGKRRRASTESLPIGGGAGYPSNEEKQKAWIEDLAAQTNLSTNRARILFARYGTRAEEIASYLAQGQDRPLEHHSRYSWREIAYLVKNEMVTHLDDLILRRSLLAWLGQLTPDLLKELAEITAQQLNWSRERVEKEIERTREILSHDHGVTF